MSLHHAEVSRLELSSTRVLHSLILRFDPVLAFCCFLVLLSVCEEYTVSFFGMGNEIKQVAQAGTNSSGTGVPGSLDLFYALGKFSPTPCQYWLK